MTDLASKINAYLSPVRRQALYKILAVLGILVTAVSPALSTPVAQWTSVITAAATVASLILASIVTRAPQWPAIYTGLITALVGASIFTAAVADQTLRIIEAVITVAPLLVILARTDTRTIDGSPVAEVVLSDAAPMALDEAKTPDSYTVAGGDKVVFNPDNGNAPTTTTLS
jgi:hypothetical protein